MPSSRGRLGAVLVVALACSAVATALRWRPVDTWVWTSEILSALAIFAIALALGLAILRVTRLDRSLEPLEVLVQALAMGLGALVLAVLTIGLVGWLSRGVLVGTLAVALAAGAAAWRQTWPGLRDGVVRLVREVRSVPAAALLIALALAMTATGALLPAVFYDSLLYHLEAPAKWLAAGRLAAVPYTFHLNYPVNASILYLLTQSLDPGTSAGMVHWGFLVSAALALVSLGAAVAPRVGVMAAALFVVMPSVLEISQIAMADLVVVFFCLAAVSAWRGWFRGGDRALLALAGIELGLAVGTKYTAIMVGLVPLLVMTVAFGRSATIRRRLGDAVVLGSMAVLSFSPWLIRNGVETGNPMYPYFFSCRAPFAVDHSFTQEVENRVEGGEGVGPFLLHVARGPVVLLNDGLGTAPLVGLSLFLPLPLLLLKRRLRRSTVQLLAIVGVGFLLWDMTVHLTRYALPFLAVLAVPAAVALVREPVRWRRRVVGAAVGLGLMQNLLLGWLTVDWGALRDLVRGHLTRDQYIAEHVSCYGVVTYANQHLRPTDRILFFGEARGYYCRIPHVTTGSERRARLFDIAEQRGDRSLGDAIKQRGFTHILMTRSEVNRLIVEGRPAPPSLQIQQEVSAFFESGVEVQYDDGNGWLARVR